MSNRLAVCPLCGRTLYCYRGQLFDTLEGAYLTGQITPRETRDLAHRFVYLPHTCLERDVEAYAERSARALAALQEHRTATSSTWDRADLDAAIDAARDTSRALLALSAAHALTRECPKCQATVGQTCFNLTERRRGVHTPTRNPHAERLGQVEPLENTDLLALRARLDEQQSLVEEINAALDLSDGLGLLIDRLLAESAHLR